MKKKHKARRRKARRDRVDYQRISSDVVVMPTKVKTAIFLDREQVADLKIIQRETGVPMSFSIRKALDQYLAERKKNEPELNN